MIKAPWTPEQVQTLNDFQKYAAWHSFTCYNGHDLVATENGWICEQCPDYTQDWCYEIMADYKYWKDKDTRLFVNGIPSPEQLEDTNE